MLGDALTVEGMDIMLDEVDPSVKVRQGRQEQQLERASIQANSLAAAYTPFSDHCLH